MTAQDRQQSKSSDPSRKITRVSAPLSPGELIDKIAILEIKSQRIRDKEKLEHVRAELGALSAVRDREIPPSPRLTELTAALRHVNEILWEVEDKIRLCERARDFGHGFISLARSVYAHNDRRAELKRAINRLLGSELVEEKLYPRY